MKLMRFYDNSLEKRVAISIYFEKDIYEFLFFNNIYNEMGYKSDFDLSEIRKGRIIKRTDSDEIFEIGDFHPHVEGWELRPDGRNTLHWDGILLYLKPEKIPGRFDLLDED